MKKLMFIGLLVTMMFAVSGCSRVEVPPGYLGKMISAEGVHPELYGQGRVVIPWFSTKRLIFIESASNLRPADLTVIMADRYVDEDGNEQVRPGAKMQFQLNVRFRVNPDKAVINAALKDMKLSKGTSEITAMDFYNKYGGIAVGKVGREVLGKYTPREVMSNLDAINATLLTRLNEELAGTPLVLSHAALGPFSLPDAIQSQIDENLRTEESKVKKQAEQEIALLDKQNEIELARQQAIRERVDAQSLAEQNRILNASITPEVLRLRELSLEEKRIEMQREVMSKALANGNNNSVFIPYGALDSVGANNRMFQK